MPNLVVSVPVDTFLQASNAAGMRTALGLGTLATQSGTFSGNSSGVNTGDQDLSPYALISSLSGYVPTSRTVNGQALTSNIVITTISGNAGSATVLQTARSINGVSFDGSADITVPAAAGTLTGATLASGVTASSLTSFGASIALGTPASGNLANCTFPTLNQNTTGSAATLTTPRAINGVNFDGSAAITVTAAAGTLTGTALNATVVTSSLTTLGTITTGVWTGTTIAIANGGTGQTSANAALNALLPSQTGANTKVLQSDGTNTSWQTVSGGSTGANPTASIGLAAVNGVAATFLRSDGAPALDVSIAPTWTGLHAFTKKVTFGSTQSAAAWTTGGIALSIPAASYTDSSSSGTVATTAVTSFGIPTLLASSSTTYTDSFSVLMSGPPVASTNVTQTRAHTIGILDSTSAASSITGALVIATAFGTTATSVGIGAGNINAGAAITSGGAITSGSNVVAASSSAFSWTSRSKLASGADGLILLQNAGSTGFTRLQFGGTTNNLAAIGVDAVNGFTLQSAAGTATWNDNSTANSGTVANRYLFGIATPTLSSTGTSVTYTVASSFYIGGAPVNGTNVTSTTKWALNVAADNSFIAALTLGSTTLLTTNVALTNGAGAGAGTISNAPAAGNPTKWVPINDNGTTRYLPAW